MKSLVSSLLSFGAFVCLGCFTHAQNFDDDFDSGDINDRWLVQRNAVGSVEIVQEDAHAVVTATSANANGGLASVAAFDPITDGIYVSFDITEIIGGPNANGFLVGVVDDNEVFHRNTNNFGIAAFGQEARTFSAGGFSLIVGDQNGSNQADLILDEGQEVDRASFEDGFRVVLSADDAGWSYVLEGLQDVDGNDTVFENTGTWEDAGTTFQDIFGQDSSWHVLTADQSPGEKITRFDRITLGDPKPASDPDIRVASSLSLGQLPSVPEIHNAVLSVRNGGETQALEITGAELAGPDAEHFTVAADQFPISIAPGQSGEVALMINSSGETGGFLATLTLLTNDPAPAEDSRIAVELTASVINLQGPIAHYPMDELDLPEMRDITGFNRSGVYLEGVIVGNEGLAGGTAMNVHDGASATVGGRVFDDATFETFSISLWFQADSVAETGTLIANGLAGESPAFALLVADGNLSWFVDVGSDLDTNNSGLVDGGIHHAVVTYAPDQVVLYVDGEQKGVNDSPESFSIEPSAPIHIGAFGPLAFNGVIDDVQIYGRALAIEDVTFLHDHPGQPLGTIGPVDSDGDGLSDEDEVNTHKTDPLVADTDGDGLNDGDEVAANSNPLEIDTDMGGAWDGFEVASGTDPGDPDDDPAVWSVRTLKSRTSLTTIGNVEALVSDQAFSDEIRQQHATLNFVGADGGTGNFEGDVPFDNTDEINGANVDDFAVVATTEIFIAQTGTYTFGFNSDDGGRLKVGEATVAVFDGTRGAGDSLGTIALTPGFQTVEVLMFDRGGGAALEVYWDPNPGDSSASFASGRHVLLTGTEVRRMDSDGDDLDDNWETAAFGDLSKDGNGDEDGDGLTNQAEHDLGTDPTGKDTDGDGLEDGPEVNEHNTSPLNPDTDGDLRSDGDEINGNPASDPLDEDTDDDGFRDGFEVAQNSDPGNAASLPADKLGEPDASWHEFEALPTFNGFRGGDDVNDVTFRVFIDFNASTATDDEREIIWESGGGTVGFSLVYETGNKLVLRAAGNGGNTVATVAYELTAAQIATGALPVIWTFDVDNGNPAAAQTIALYVDNVLVGEDRQDMDADWSGSNDASFGIGSSAFAAGGDNTSLTNGIDFTSGNVDLNAGLQFFADTLFAQGDGGGNPPDTAFSIRSIGRTTTALNIGVVGELGVTVDLEYSSDMSARSWTPIMTDIVLGEGDTSIEDTDTGRRAAAQGFYRVVRID